MSAELTFTFPVHLRLGPKGQRVMAPGVAPCPVALPQGRVPRLARLMALSVRIANLIEHGHVTDMAEVARMGHVSRARVTQLMNLGFLAPDIQEELLFLPSTVAGHDPINEWQMRPIAATLDWKKQRRLWRELRAQCGVGQRID